MGFWDFAKKMVMGEPVFKAQQNAQNNAGHQQPTKPEHTAGEPAARPAGPKVIPQVMIERWLCDEKGAGLHCEITVRNYSKGGVVLQRIEVLGVRDELGYHLDAGEHYEFQLHLGLRPKDTHLDVCDIYFKDETGDYFLAKHQIEFEKLPDGTFNILRFRLIPPIRDI